MAANGKAAPGANDGLNPDDPGVIMLADAVKDVAEDQLLLVCCGDLGGRFRDAHRLILDARERRSAGTRAVPYAQWPSIAGSVDTAVVWPRAHLGKDFSQQCLAVGMQSLREGGRLLCAVRKQKGADSIADFMGESFGNVRVLERTKGYRLFVSEKEGEVARPEILDRRYSFSDERLGGLELQSAPGSFSRKGLDAGTQCLMDHVAGMELAPARVVDLGAGVGPLALWAATRWGECEVVAVESNFVSAGMLRENVKAAGLGGRVFAMEHDGLPSTVAAVRQFVGTTDLTITNPPTHMDAKGLAGLLGPLASWQRKGSKTVAVVSRPEMVATALREAGAGVTVVGYGRFSVLEGVW